METNKVNKFKLKDPNKNNNQDNKVSKYFKPGFIYNQVKQAKANDDNLNLDLSDEDDDLNEIISQASAKFCRPTSTFSSTTDEGPSSKRNKLLKPETVQRMNQIESQSVDFTTKSTSTTIPSLKGTNTILVNSNQKQNPLLQNLRATRYVITDSIAPAHYLLFDSCCALFLSLKYHVINPNYIYERIAELHNKYQLKILLVMIDHIIYEQSLKELSIMAVRTNFTLILAWTYEEAARHIENYRLYSDKPPDLIMGRTEDNSKSSSTTHQQSLMDALTTVKAVNRTDAMTLLSTFENFENIIKANTDELTVCPGISMVKARRLHSLFNKPFIKTNRDQL